MASRRSSLNCTCTRLSRDSIPPGRSIIWVEAQPIRGFRMRKTLCGLAIAALAAPTAMLAQDADSIARALSNPAAAKSHYGADVKS